MHNEFEIMALLIFFQKAQEEVEKHLKTAELLSLQGDTQGQRDQLVNELLRVHTRFQARINEYQILLKMTVKFFEDLREVKRLFSDAEDFHFHVFGCTKCEGENNDLC